MCCIKRGAIDHIFTCRESTTYDLDHSNFSIQTQDSFPSPELSNLDRVLVYQLGFSSLNPDFDPNRAFRDVNICLDRSYVVSMLLPWALLW